MRHFPLYLYINISFLKKYYLYTVKKVLTAIIALCYLVFVSGFAINVHYCMGKIDTIKIGAKHSEECGRCGMHTEDSKGCCKDETSFYKIDDNHFGSAIPFHFSNYTALIQNNCTYSIAAPAFVVTPTNFYTDTSPPFLQKDRCIIYGNFRI
jgi:hypothetical protein